MGFGKDSEDDGDSIDKSLLSRLNALRSSSEASNSSSSVDNLADRFAKLGNRPSGTKAVQPDPDDVLNSNSRQDGPTIEYNVEDGKTIEELLSEVGNPTNDHLEQIETDRATELLKQAREALSKSSELDKDETKEDIHIDSNNGQEDALNAVTEEEETDEYIQRVLAEIELDSKNADFHSREQTSPETRSNADEADETPAVGETTGANNSPETAVDYDSILNLPTAPTHLPSTHSSHGVQTDLGIKLPSPPKSVPGSSVPAFTEEEIESWCIICNDDAEIRCLGCDNDLYCSTCWYEGHKSPDAGYEERMHKAVAFTKPAPQPKKTVGTVRRKAAAGF